MADGCEYEFVRCHTPTKRDVSDFKGELDGNVDAYMHSVIFDRKRRPIPRHMFANEYLDGLDLEVGGFYPTLGCQRHHCFVHKPGQPNAHRPMAAFLGRRNIVVGIHSRSHRQQPLEPIESATDASWRTATSDQAEIH